MTLAGNGRVNRQARLQSTPHGEPVEPRGALATTGATLALRRTQDEGGPRAKGISRPVPPAINRYLFLKAIAHFEGAWEACQRRQCRARRQCTGGPRGTCEKVGVPLCRRHAPPEWWAELAEVLDGQE